MNESVFMLDDECAPLIAYHCDEIAYQERAVTEMEKFFRSVTGKSET